MILILLVIGVAVYVMLLWRDKSKHCKVSNEEYNIVPQGSLKETNEETYRGPWYHRDVPPVITTGLYDNSFPYYRDIPPLNTSDDYFHPYRCNHSHIDPPFGELKGGWYGNVSAYAPFQEIDTPWEKIGMLLPITNPDNLILTLFRRAIAPRQDVFQYIVQDKDGNIIPLNGINYIVNKDIVPAEKVVGYENKGDFIAKTFVDNKFIYVP